MRPVAHRKATQVLPGKWRDGAELPSVIPRAGVYASLWEVDADELLQLTRGGRVMLALDISAGGHPIVRLQVVR